VKLSTLRGTTVILAGLAMLAAACGSAVQHGSSVRPGSSTTTTAPPTAPTAPPPSSTPSIPPTPVKTIPPVFSWSASALDTSTRAHMVGKSWHPGCPVGLDQLRLVNLTYWGFDGAAHTGQLIVNVDSVSPIVDAFRGLFQVRFPIRQMRLVDDYGGDDERSMAADNTSAFNCRLVPGTTTWSQHAYGRAVDIDPLENPEILNGQVDPSTALPWANRSRSDPAMIRAGDAAWQAFRAVGWKWGGDWVSLKDYMHFSANGL
jgi:hypothetical protein